jgi:hypothetical protein
MIDLRLPSGSTLLIFSLITLIAGCSPPTPPAKPLVWDLSAGTTVTALNGGSWVPPQAGKVKGGQVYHVTGHRGQALSVILPSDRRFDFDCVKHVYATKSEDKLRTINVASCGYSEEGVTKRLQDMHKKWGGDGIGDIVEWRKGVRKGSLSSHLTVIHRPTGPDDPFITAAIHYNFAGDDEAWFIMVTFFWKLPLE